MDSGQYVGRLRSNTRSARARSDGTPVTHLLKSLISSAEAVTPRSSPQAMNTPSARSCSELDFYIHGSKVRCGHRDGALVLSAIAAISLNRCERIIHSRTVVTWASVNQPRSSHTVATRFARARSPDNPCSHCRSKLCPQYPGLLLISMSSAPSLSDLEPLIHCRSVFESARTGS